MNFISRDSSGLNWIFENIQILIMKNDKDIHKIWRMPLFLGHPSFTMHSLNRSKCLGLVQKKTFFVQSALYYRICFSKIQRANVLPCLIVVWTSKRHFWVIDNYEQKIVKVINPHWKLWTWNSLEKVWDQELPNEKSSGITNVHTGRLYIGVARLKAEYSPHITVA